MYTDGEKNFRTIFASYLLTQLELHKQRFHDDLSKINKGFRMFYLLFTREHIARGFTCISISPSLICSRSIRRMFYCAVSGSGNVVLHNFLQEISRARKFSCEPRFIFYCCENYEGWEGINKTQKVFQLTLNVSTSGNFFSLLYRIKW